MTACCPFSSWDQKHPSQSQERQSAQCLTHFHCSLPKGIFKRHLLFPCLTKGSEVPKSKPSDADQIQAKVTARTFQFSHLRIPIPIAYGPSITWRDTLWNRCEELEMAQAFESEFQSHINCFVLSLNICKNGSDYANPVVYLIGSEIVEVGLCRLAHNGANPERTGCPLTWVDFFLQLDPKSPGTAAHHVSAASLSN